MANQEDEIRDLREKNSELALEVQHWKQLAAQREREKLELMKDINELRLKLSKLRSGGEAEALKLDTALQAASEEALSHLVQASGAVARSVELTKQYLRNVQELESSSPRWSTLSGTPIMNTDKVHRVPPTLVGGQSIQPVVALSRTMLNSSTRSRNQNPNVTERGAVPMHLLSDVYIPLTRINIDDLQSSMEADNDEVNNSMEDIDTEGNTESITEDSQEITDEYETSRRLDVVMEDEESVETPQRSQPENPLEGPSWLLDVATTSVSSRTRTLPDSTTGEVNRDNGTAHDASPVLPDDNEMGKETIWLRMAFTPTIRRKRTVRSPPQSPLDEHSHADPSAGDFSPCGVLQQDNDALGENAANTPSPARDVRAEDAANAPVASPHFSPRRPVKKKQTNQNRILKVMVAKMRMTSRAGAGDAGDASPAKRAALEVRNDVATPSNYRIDAESVAPPDERSGIYTQKPEPNSSSEPPASENRDLGNLNASIEIKREPKQSRHNTMPPSPENTTENRHRSLENGINAESQPQGRTRASRNVENVSRQSNNHNQSASDSDSSIGQVNEGKSRRPRKVVTYKEKPLNRKMRR